MGKFQRVFVIVLDSLGFGAMPDAEQYGDSNVDTIGHIADAASYTESAETWRSKYPTDQWSSVRYGTFG